MIAPYCCTTAGCSQGLHGAIPFGQPHEMRLNEYTTLYATPTYVVPTVAQGSSIPMFPMFVRLPLRWP